MFFLDPEYFDEKVALVKLTRVIDIKEGKWVNENHEATLTTFWKNYFLDS